MSARRVVLWRHGQTDLNVQQRIQGAQDFPLNDVGRAQAARVAHEVAAMSPDRIISSPLSRASDTAQQVVELVGIPMEWDGRLRERNYGEWEGLTRTQIQKRDPEQFRVWIDGGYPEGLGVERNVDVGERVATAVSEAAHEMADGTLLVVAHGAAIRAGTGMRRTAGSRGCFRAMPHPRVASGVPPATLPGRIFTPSRKRARVMARNWRGSAGGSA